MKRIDLGVVAMVMAIAGCSGNSGLVCTAGLTTCPGLTPGQDVCVDTQNDPQNCGACGQTCTDGGICALSSCVPSGCGAACKCPQGQDFCGVGDGGQCTNLAYDPANCGACGTSCSDGGFCSAGSCRLACSEGATLCGAAGGQGSLCVDTLVDPQNCGGCGVACVEGAVCSLGNCTPAGCGSACGCPPLESACTVGDGGVCTNLANDPANCGACGTVCPDGICAGGRCASECPPGTTLCGADAGAGVCAYLPRDPFNCGQCGTACFGGSGSCLLGQCYEALPPPLPEARWTLAAATDLDGGVYAMGGSDVYGRSYGTVWRYSGTSAGWSTLQEMPTARSALAATTGKDGKIYAIGGLIGSLVLGATEAYDPETGGWTSLSPLPTPRCWFGAATAADGRIYTFGGQVLAPMSLPDGGVQVSVSASSVVEIYDPTSGQWSTGPSMPTARWGHAVAYGPDGTFYVMGGQDTGALTDVVERLLPDGGWEPAQSLSSARSGLAAAVGPNGLIYAISGYASDGTVVGTVQAYDTSPATWSLADSLPTPRYGLAATTGVGARGYVFAIGGGVNGPLGAVFPTVEVLATDVDQWQ